MKRINFIIFSSLQLLILSCSDSIFQSSNSDMKQDNAENLTVKERVRPEEEVININSAPSAPKHVVLTEDLLQENTASCVASGSEDPDGDEIEYIYEWKINDEIWMKLESKIEDVDISHDDYLQCRASAFDGEKLSASRSSLGVIVGKSQRNFHTGVHVTPGQLDTSTTAICSVNKDSLLQNGAESLTYYEWNINNEGWLFKGQSLSSSHYQKGDELVCRLIITDHDGVVSLHLSDRIVVGNIAPDPINSVSIPALSSDMNELTCSVNGELSDQDQEDSLSLTYNLQKLFEDSWTDVKQQGNGLFSDLNLLQFEIYRCAVAVSDGVDFSKSTYSEESYVEGVWSSSLVLGSRGAGSTTMRDRSMPQFRADPSVDKRHLATWVFQKDRARSKTYLGAMYFSNGAWESMVELAQIDLRPKDLELAMSSEGKAIVSWGSESGDKIWLNTFVEGAWGELQEIDLGSTAKVAFSSANSGHIVYVSLDNSDHLARRVSSRSFAIVDNNLSVSNEINHLTNILSDSGKIIPDITFDKNNHGFAVWGAEKAFVYGSHYSDGKWSEAVKIGDNLRGQAQVKTDPTTEAKAIAVWSQYTNMDEKYSKIYANTFYLGSWRGTNEISHGNSMHRAVRPVFDFLSNGEALLAWTHDILISPSASYKDILWYSHYKDSGWGEAFLIESPGYMASTNALYPQISIGPSDNAVIAWTGGRIKSNRGYRNDSSGGWFREFKNGAWVNSHATQIYNYPSVVRSVDNFTVLSIGKSGDLVPFWVQQGGTIFGKDLK